MKFNLRLLFFIFFLQLMAGFAFAQSGPYILNGSVTKDKCNCYTLTHGNEAEKASLWNSEQIDLNSSFDYVFRVNFGCNDLEGADGIAFILQPFSTSLGADGQGMGFAGIDPSIGITLDTYQNLNDPSYDHISIQLNGQVEHGNDLAGPVRASDTSDNIEDCKWHLLRIVWDAQNLKISAYFDNILRVQANIDIVKTVFNNNPHVYWGFSAATGGSANVQQVCSLLDPAFTTGFQNNAACLGATTNFVNESQLSSPPKSYYWDLGDGTISSSAVPGPHTYSDAGIYQAKLSITGFDGCVSDTMTKQVVIGDKPVPLFEISDTCAGIAPRIEDKTTVKVGGIVNWNWNLDGSPVSSSQIPSLSGLPAGNHELQLSAKSSVGCISGAFVSHFYLKPVPAVELVATDNCINEPGIFKGIQKDNVTSIKYWTWRFGDGQTSNSQDATHTYLLPGIKNIQLSATDINGCASAPAAKNIFINKVTAFAGNDTIVVDGTYFQLKGKVTQSGSDPVNIKWSPSEDLDLSIPGIAKGTATQNKIYTMLATTSEGCSASDDIEVIIFKGSAAYVPSAFTPNNDGKNEKLKPYLISIKQVYNFSVYNRWGQLVYSTTASGDGWDGTLKSVPQPVGTYVWMLKAVDVVGNVYNKKGTVTLIR
jgi:gliding motility-associated-like protein